MGLFIIAYWFWFNPISAKLFFFFYIIVLTSDYNFFFFNDVHACLLHNFCVLFFFFLNKLFQNGPKRCHSDLNDIQPDVYVCMYLYIRLILYVTTDKYWNNLNLEKKLYFT